MANKLYPYVGHRISDGKLVVIKTDLPQQHHREAYGNRYTYLIGPFRTLKAAVVMAAYGGNGNPHLQHVDDAERMARRMAKTEPLLLQQLVDTHWPKVRIK